MKFTFALLLVGFFQVVTGSPVIPRAVTHLEYDTRSEKVYMYHRDGSLHGVYSKRQFDEHYNQTLQTRDSGSSCQTALTIIQVPGWSKLEDFAKKTWGGGSYNLETNPKDYPDRPANVCVDTNTVKLKPNGPISCNTQKSVAHGTFSGTKGVVALSQKSSSSVSGSWTVTKTTSITDSSTFSVGISIEGFGLGASFTHSTTITNTQSKSFTTSSKSSNQVTVKGDTPKGKTCTFTLETKTCKQDTQGSLPLIASGFVWFNYDDSRAPIADPKGGKHFKYAASIEGVLTNKADRSGVIGFQGPVNMISNSGYDAKCR